MSTSGKDIQQQQVKDQQPVPTTVAEVIAQTSVKHTTSSNHPNNNKYNDIPTLLRKAAERTAEDPFQTDLVTLRNKTSGSNHSFEKYFRQHQPASTAEENQDLLLLLPSLRTGKASCRLCKVAEFPNGVQEQRTHFKSQWHLLNLTLNERGKPVVSEEESRLYNQVEEPVTDNEEEEDEQSTNSSTASDDDDSAEEDSTQQKDLVVNTGRNIDHITTRTDISQEGPTTISVLESFNDNEQQQQQQPICIRMNACACRDEAEMKDLICSPQPQIWGVILYRSGHFAAATFQEGKLRDHKTEHRYTQRKKQGGSQAAHDSKGSKAKSAGAQLRRYGEQTMRERVAKVMAEWDWKSCTRVFLAVPERARKLFVISSKQQKKSSERNDPRFVWNDARIRRIPFMTNRPTLDECERVFKIMNQVEVFRLDLASYGSNSVAAAAGGDEKLDSKPSSEVKVQPSSNIELTEEERGRKEIERYRQMGYEDLPIHAAVKADDFELVKSVVLDQVRSKALNGDTPLHIACESASMKSLDLLLQSCSVSDLACKDLLGRVPYQRARDVQVRNVLRTFRGSMQEKEEDDDESEEDLWRLTLIPEPPREKSEEEIRLKKEREKEKKKRQQERKKHEKLALERQQKQQEEERMAREAALKAGMECKQCKNPLPSKKKDRFSQGSEEFCSALCMRNRTRTLAADAADRRLQSSVKQ